MPSNTILRFRQFLNEFDAAQATRFVVVGLVNTGFSYLVYACLLFFGLNFALANLGAVLLGVFFSFRTQGALVFYNTNRNLLGRFVLAWAIVYLITIVIIWSLVKLGINPYTGGALALPASALASYFVQKYFVFR